jgi:hypothetical protein
MIGKASRGCKRGHDDISRIVPPTLCMDILEYKCRSLREKKVHVDLGYV